MTPKALTESILLQAFQGKLVPHDNNEGTGKDVLVSLNKELQEKQRLGLIKKSKTSAECSESEIEFDVPENWEIAKLGFLCQLLDGEKRSSQNYPYLEARYLRGKAEPTILSEGKYVPASTNVILVDGENSGEVFTLSEEGYMGSTFKVLFIPECLNQKYIIYFLMLHKSTLRNNKKGAAIPHLNKDIFFNLALPIPPIAEQNRIVAKLEEILPLIDRYEVAWNKLEEFNKRFPDDMQKSILQLAIQGKLVEQRPEEGTGEELFQQIQAEKQSLIKAGKIKKEKPLPEIAEDEIPFDIPETWRWVRLSQVLDVRDGTHDTPKYVLDGVPLVTSKNLVDGRIDFETTKLISYEDAAQINIRSAVDDNDILFAMIGTIGNPVLVKRDREFCIKNMALFKAVNQDLFSMDYLLLYLQNEQHSMKKKASGGVQSFVSLGFLRNYLLPLPPLAEQKRIVAKLEEILPLCERLK